MAAGDQVRICHYCGPAARAKQAAERGIYLAKAPAPMVYLGPGLSHQPGGAIQTRRPSRHNRAQSHTIVHFVQSCTVAGKIPQRAPWWPHNVACRFDPASSIAGLALDRHPHEAAERIEAQVAQFVRCSIRLDQSAAAATQSAFYVSRLCCAPRAAQIYSPIRHRRSDITTDDRLPTSSRVRVRVR